MKNQRRRTGKPVESRALTCDATGKVLATWTVYRDGRLELRAGKGLTGAEKERCAAWLEDVLPDKSHDQRFAMLFGDGV